MNKFILSFILFFSTYSYGCYECMQEITNLIRFYRYELKHKVMDNEERMRVEGYIEGLAKAKDIYIQAHCIPCYPEESQ